MDVVEQIEGVLNRATQDFDGRDDIMQRAADEIKRLRALAERAGGVRDETCRNQWGDLVTTAEAASDLYAAFRASPHSHKTIGYRSDLWTVLGECIAADRTLSTLEHHPRDTSPVVSHETANVRDKPPAPEGQQEPVMWQRRIRYPEHGAVPSEQAVTEAMVEAACRAYNAHLHGKGCPVWEDEHPPMLAALKAAMEEGG